MANTPSADDLAAASAGTSAVRAAFDEVSLARWLQDNVRGYAGELKVEQFNGGQSNPTYKLLTSTGQAYVMRRKPPGKLLESAHAVDREFMAISSLAGTGVPVPKTFGLCKDESVIGTWFYVMEFLNGRIIWDLFTNNDWREQRRAILFSAVDAIAALHQVDYVAVGLGGYGKPGNYVERQFKRWSGQYEYTKDALPNPGLDALMKWIPNNIPKDDRTTIVHGDPSINNMMFHREKPEVIALLDWELSTLGHPTTDLAYLCMPYFNDEANDTLRNNPASLGFPTVDELIARYCQRTGVKEVPSWMFFMVFGMFRLSAILQGIAKRAQDGTAASSHAVLMGQRAVTLAERAMDLTKRVA